MIPFALWAAVLAVGLATTALWAILARKTGVFVTSGISFVSYSWAAVVGGDVAMLTQTGDVVYLRDGLPALQFALTALAIISLVVFGLRVFGAYPSPTNNAAEHESGSTDTQRRQQTND